MNYFSIKLESDLILRTILLIFLLLVVGFLLNNFLISLEFELIEIIINSISDAYLQVSVFVAAVLLIFYGFESLFGINLNRKLQNSGIYQVPVASALGALPGCGGAILVITQFTKGGISFGSVVAVLTSTMGDAAFLLIASEPQTGIFIIILGFVVGVMSGWFVDLTHPKNYLIPKEKNISVNNKREKEISTNFKIIWTVLIIPGLIIGIMMAFQVDMNEYIKIGSIQNIASLFGFLAGLSLIIFHLIACKGKFHKKTSLDGGSSFERTYLDTNFVTIWVVIAFLLFELIIYYTAFDLKSVFNSYVFLTPLIAVLVGFIPGCGPQIIITSTYLMGIIPLSAQIGNAISNDGDALFPVLAISPKVGLIATLYSAVPAIIVSYGYLLIFE